jgi:hypothetical protein
MASAQQEWLLNNRHADFNRNYKQMAIALQ